MTSEHSSPAPDATPERQAILADIEETREQLGQTVEALAAKADVKAQVQHKAAQAAGAARQQVQRVASARPLNLAQWQILRHLRGRPWAQQELAAALGRMCTGPPSPTFAIRLKSGSRAQHD